MTVHQQEICYTYHMLMFAKPFLPNAQGDHRCEPLLEFASLNMYG
jgi:hypothetical protein